jgi:AcrR family transcriptional regulator
MMVNRQRSTTQTIDLILSAAERVVMRDGVMRLTIDAVAREAKLSKGGVLYHFGTKETLIQAMLERLIQYCEREMAAHQQHDGEPGSWTRAYVRKTSEPMLAYPG